MNTVAADHRVIIRATGQTRRWVAMALVALLVGFVATAVSSVDAPRSGAQAPPARPLTAIPSLGGSPASMAFDAAGNLYIADGRGVAVLPKVSGSVFGIAVMAGTLTTVVSGLELSWGLAFDAAGNLYIGATGGVFVLPKSTGSVFGVAVTADTLTMVAPGFDEPLGLAFDSVGNLYIANGDEVSVLAKSSGSVFGVAVTADTVTVVAPTSAVDPIGLAFDAGGNLYLLGAGVWVLAKASGTVFGVAVTADTLTTLVSPGRQLNLGNGGLAFDAAGDLYLTDGLANSVLVLPTSSGMLFGVPVTANTLKAVALNVDEDFGSTSPDSDGEIGFPTGLTLDASGDLFISTGLREGVSVLAHASGVRLGVPVTANTLSLFVPTPGYIGALAFDGAGNLYVASGGAIWVLPKTSGALFGHQVTANRWSLVLFAEFGGALAFDAAGNLYVAEPSGVVVLPKASGTVFGIAVTADIPATVTPSLDGTADGLAFDASGDLYILTKGTLPPYLPNDGSLQVIATTSGLLFGAPVVADIPTTLQKFDYLYPSGLAIDKTGDLVITTFDPQSTSGGATGVQVLPKTTGSFFGVAVTANTLSTIASGLNDGGGAAFDAAGNLYLNSYQALSYISVLPKNTGTLFGVPVIANQVTAVLPYSHYSISGPLAFDVAGDLFGSDGLDPVVQEYKATGDIGVTVQAPSHAADQSSFTETFTVTNHGPSLATQVDTNLLVPEGLSVTAAPGATLETGTLVYVDPWLAVGASVTYTVTFTVFHTVHATVALGGVTLSVTQDPNLGNNVASATLTLG